MSNRRKLRESAVQVLYALDFYAMNSASALESFHAHMADGCSEDQFLAKLVTGVNTRRDDIDNLIREFSTNWRLERMAVVDRNILRLATFELVHLPEIPRKVCINEAIEVAKRYGGDDSPSFINGILDRIALEIRGPETEEEKANAVKAGAITPEELATEEEAKAAALEAASQVVEEETSPAESE